ncbi:MAG: hypothetical protein D6719_06980 [Candidatus Dadabacteria bacterium]|nr:MAG: hypothetical protein D6719_06980 [Candidatus Dadabacteria bacterium]
MDSGQSVIKNRLIIFVAFIGACLSVVSLYHFAEFKYDLKVGESFCNINEHFNCDAVTASKWSTLFGFPVAGYGLIFYLGIIFFTLLSCSQRYVTRSVFNSVMTLLSTLALLFSFYLFLISEFLIGTLCPTCLAMYAVNIGLFAASFMDRGEKSFYSLLQEGIRNVAVYFKALIGKDIPDGDVKAIVRASFVVVVILFLFSLVLPEFLVLKFIYPANYKKKLEQNASESVSKWRRAPVTPVNIRTDEGALMRDYSSGPRNAPVRIVEFADFECPACRMIYLSVHEILERYPNKIYFVFKNYPLDNACNPGIKREFHRNACFAAQLARCAGEQGLFWQAVDYLFTQPTLEEKLPVNEIKLKLLGGASRIGADLTALRECVTSGRQLAAVSSDIKEGDRLKLSATPSFWINDKKVEHPNPKVLDEIIKSILDGARLDQ